MAETLIIERPSRWKRTLPHVFALLSGVGAYWIVRLLPEPRGFLIAVVGTFALIAVPLFGAAFGAVLVDTTILASVLKPYLRATAWMWGLMVIVALVAAVVGDQGLIPTETAAEGTVAFLIYVGVTIALLWPWFVVPAAQIIHSVRRPAESTNSIN